jgi:uncharacterized membrane protein
MTNLQYESGVVDAGGCISNAWEMIKQRYWMYVGISFLAFIITSYLYCISWFVIGPIMGGVFLVALRDMRGEPVDFGMMFKGFEKFVPLMIVGLVQSIPRILGDMIGIFANVAQIAMLPMSGRDRDFFQSSQPEFQGLPFAITGVMLVVALIVMVVFIIIALVWRVAFFCAIPLMLEHEMSPMDAIKLSIQAGFANVGSLIVLIILEGLILIASFFLICVGMFFIGFPIMYVADAFAYRLIFPHMERQFNMAPPPPTAYGFGGGQPGY